jgi:formamidopyrimidine-DNA glycosylase
MPELPEVETVVRDLERVIVGKTITLYKSEHKRFLESKKQENQLGGAKVISVIRIGKNICITVKRGSVVAQIVIHLKMTGHILMGRWKKEHGVWIATGDQDLLREKVNTYIRAIWTFDDGTQMALCDARKFARILIGSVQEIKEHPWIKNIGPDLFDAKLSSDVMYEKTRKRTGTVKQILLNQTILAGIGNIYADEILWKGKIDPRRKAKDISKDGWGYILKIARLVVKKAIDARGASMSDYRDIYGEKGLYGEMRMVYKRTGKKCLRCNEEIKRIVIAGRGTHWCATCQQ